MQQEKKEERVSESSYGEREKERESDGERERERMEKGSRTKSDGGPTWHTI